MSMVMALAAPGAGAVFQKPRVLIFPIKGAAGAGVEAAERATALLVAASANAQGFEVKSVADVELAAQHEQLKQGMGCDDVGCATDLAASLNAEQLVTGTLTSLGKSYLLSMSRVRARDAVALARVSETLVDLEKDLLVKMPALTKALFTDERVPEVAVDLRVLAKRAGTESEVALQGGEALKAGDSVAFEFTVTPGAHVYLIQRTRASGAVNVLFPSADIAVKNPLAAGARVRIPSDGQMFEVDNQDLGLENVYIVASPHPLPRLQEAVAKMEGGEVTASTRAQAEGAMVALLQADGCKKLDGCKASTRGLKLKTVGVKQEFTARLRSAPGDDAVFHVFAFDHVDAAAR